MSSKLSFKEVFTKGAIIYNPVLIQLVGLCPVVAASTTLARAAVLSGILCGVLIITCVVASLFLKKISRWLRVPLYLIIGIAIICPVMWYIETKTLINISLGMEIFLPLVAVNSMTAVHCEQFSVKNSVKLSFYDAAAAGIGASLIFIITGAIRELLGSSTIGGMPVNLPITFKGMALPFGCFVLLGFMAAALKAVLGRFFPEYVEDTEDAASVTPERAEDEVTEVELFEEFWSQADEAEYSQAEENRSDAPTEIPLEIPLEAPEESPKRESEGHTFNSAAELDEFLRSLGIELDGEGDKR